MLTDKWPDTYNLLEMIKISTKPSTASYNVIIAKSFKENQLDIGWKLLNEMITIDRSPNCDVFLSYLKAVREKGVEKIDEILSFIGENRIIVSLRVITQLKNIYQNFQYDCKFTTIHSK